MSKHVCSFSLLLLALSLSAQTSSPPDKSTAQAPYVIPPEIANQSNPVKATAESQAKAKKVYGYDCAMCHGKEGGGDGEMVKEMKLNLTDLRDPATLKDTKDGELFYIIKNGKNAMPQEGNRAKDDVIWNLVIYIRAMSNKKS